MDNPNILLIVLDTARASHVYDRSVMPHLNEFADEGLRFTNAYTTGPWSLPSHASLFTGQYTSDHQTHANSQQFDPDVMPLAAQLQSVDYETVAFSNNVWISPSFGFDRGFDEFNLGWELFSGGADLAAISKEHDTTTERVKALSSELFSFDALKTATNAVYTKYLRKMYDSGAWLTNRRAKRWIDNSTRDDAPFFMFINYLEPHLKYDPPNKYIEEVVPEGAEIPSVDDVNQDAWAYIAGDEPMSESDFDDLEILYNAEMRYLDERLNQLFDHLSAKGVLDETFIIVTGDHGENIGDHDLMDHQYCLYDTLLNVPLIIRYPNKIEPDICEDLIELRNLYPTLLDVGGIDTAVSVRNIFDDQPRDAVFSEYWVPQPSMETLRDQFREISSSVLNYDRGLQAIRTKEWKYIEGTDGSFRLFDIKDDPQEQTDVAADHPSIVDKLQSKLRFNLGTISSPENEATESLNTGVENRLEDLGYLQ